MEWEEYEKKYMAYMYYADVQPMEYVYEGINYNCGIYYTYPITEEHYDELFSMYYLYINNLPKK